MRVFSKIK